MNKESGDKKNEHKEKIMALVLRLLLVRFLNERQHHHKGDSKGD